MTGPSYGNAMTEISLALAMAFFSIMVLTMVSMSATPPQAENGNGVSALQMAPVNTAKPNKSATIEKDQIIVYWNGRYMDHNLRTIQLETYPHRGRKVLALAPSLSMSEALSARAGLNGSDILVSTLNERWLKRLGQLDSSKKSR